METHEEKRERYKQEALRKHREALEAHNLRMKEEKERQQQLEHYRMMNPDEGLSMDEVFKKYLPSSMYVDHFKLADMYGFTPQEWRVYLRDNAQFIESEMAAMVEPAARSAISRLGQATTSEVQALKALLEKSKLINDAQKAQTKVVLTFISPTKPKEVTENAHQTSQ